MPQLVLFDPRQFEPEQVGILLGLELREEPGPYAHFLKDGEPVGYVVRQGGYDKDGLQHGVISLEKSVPVSGRLSEILA